MSTDPEKTTFGITVDRTPTPAVSMPNEKEFESHGSSNHPYSQKPAQDSSRPRSSDTLTDSPDHNPANPFSAFYAHPHARRSAEALDTGAKPQQTYLHPSAAAATTTPHKHAHAHVTESDVESGLNVPVSAATTQTNLSGMPSVCIAPSKECAMWPSRQTLLQQRKAEKRSRRRCDLFGSLTKRQKLLVQILIALVVVGAAVGVGVGISRAVGGGVWSGNGQTKQLPQDHDN